MTIGSEMIAAASRARVLLSEEARERIIAFIRSCSCEDGGYCGPSGDSDLYYSLFAVESLIALGSEPAEHAAASFAERFGNGADLDLVHLSCLIRLRTLVKQAMAPDQVRRLVGAFQSSDGAYAVNRAASSGSVYAMFLAVGAYQDAGVEIDSASSILRSLEALRSGDGAFANEPGMALGTTTATAAAVVLRNALRVPPEGYLFEWLHNRQGSDGAFRASALGPSGDLLSTATALHALCQAGAGCAAQGRRSLDFIAAHWHESGGFAGARLDEGVSQERLAQGGPLPDCEYTFYALLALGSLTSGGISA